MKNKAAIVPKQLTLDGDKGLETHNFGRRMRWVFQAVFPNPGSVEWENYELFHEMYIE